MPEDDVNPWAFPKRVGAVCSYAGPLGQTVTEHEEPLQVQPYGGPPWLYVPRYLYDQLCAEGSSVFQLYPIDGVRR
jgi:hypothetical protein